MKNEKDFFDFWFGAIISNDTSTRE
jgi:hypothetical protein